MNFLESRIRDYLVDHLGIIGQSLTLVSKEYELKNDFGAGGFIDILARDEFGHVVVIEIKRSDQAARSAIHELTKYVALLRADKGLRRDQIRALLVSTDWHELAVPFSEYLKTSEVPTEGLVISADETGTVTSVAVFQAVEAAGALTFSRAQDVILFENIGRRDGELARVAAAATEAGISDFVLLKVDYAGSNERVVYPHGIYLVFSSPLQTMSPDEALAFATARTWEDELEDPDENFLLAFRNALGGNGDDSEVGYPEKLASISSSGWHIAVAHRAGRYASNASILDDQAIVAEAQKVEGGAAYYLERTVSPKYAPSWAQLKEDSKLVLLGDSEWSILFPKLLAEIETQRGEATVSVRVYNTANIVFGLAKLFRYGENYLPSMQIVVADRDETVIYLGMLAWDGQPIAIAGLEWIERVFGSVDRFMVMQHFGETHQYEAEARRVLGISSVVFEVRKAGTLNESVSLLSCKRGRLIRTPRDKFLGHSLVALAEANPGFGSSLVEAAASFSSGWVS